MKAAWICGVLAIAVGGKAMAQKDQPVPDQSDVRIVSSFVKPGEPVQAACREEAHIFARTLVRFPRPESWHWVLVCDEAGWERFLRLSGRPLYGEIYASTDLERRTTYLRGAKLLYPAGARSGPDTVLAHELAHIQLHSRDEFAAENLGRFWQRSASEASRACNVMSPGN